MLKGADDGFANVANILAPQSVAVLGASDRPGNFGGATVRHLRKFGFRGPIWPVNRTGADVAGIHAYTTISDLPEAADLVVFGTPADSLLEAISECAARGIKSGIAFAGGLAEAGGAGAELQEKIVALCHEKDFKLCGPNCVGVINAALPLTATFATALDAIDVLTAGSISMVSQSGGIGTTTFSLGLQAGFSFRHLISSGNEAVVDFSDYLVALARDEGTRVICGYLEGIKDGDKFLRALAEAANRKKPVVLIKSGATGVGARAALAHTGALAGEDRVFDAVIREFGVARAYSVKELLEVALLLAGTAAQKQFGPGVAIATFGGGNGVIAADQCSQYGLQIPPLGEQTVQRLKPLLPSVATAANPIDLTPTTAFRDEYLQQLPKAMTAVAEDDAIDVVLLIVGTLASRAKEIIAVIDAFVQASPKPVCVAWPFPPDGLIADLARRNIHSFDEVADAVRALTRLSVLGRRPATVLRKRAEPFDWTPYSADAAASGVISEHRCHAIMREAGLAVAAGQLVNDEAAAVAVAEEIGFPVAVKGISDAVTHRAAAGLVVLALRDRDAVDAAVRTLQERAETQSIKLDGFYVQKMEEGPVELLIAATRDPLFGTMVSCAAGGGLTEIIDDIVIRRAPVDEATAAEMLEALRLRRYAKDAAGALPTGAAARFIARFSELAASAPWKRFVFESNPVKWRRGDAIAVDGLIVIGEA